MRGPAVDERREDRETAQDDERTINATGFLYWHGEASRRHPCPVCTLQQESRAPTRGPSFPVPVRPKWLTGHIVGRIDQGPVDIDRPLITGGITINFPMTSRREC